MTATDTDTLVRHGATLGTAGMVALVVFTAASVSWPRVEAVIGREPAPPPPAYQAGQTIDTPAAWHEGAPATLVLFAQASCGACQRAAPVLADLVARLSGQAAVVMAAPGRVSEEDAAFGRAIGLSDTAIHPAPPGLRVTATPTLVVVNRRGEILGAWEGVGPPERHEELAQAILAAVARAAGGV